MTIRKLKALLWFLGLAGLLGAGYTFYDIWEGKRSARYEATEPEYYHRLIRRDLDQVERDGARTPYYSKERQDTLWSARIDGSWPAPPKLPSEGAEGSAASAQVQLAKLADVLSISTIIWSNDPLSRFIAVHYADEKAASTHGGKVLSTHISEGGVLRSPYDAEPYNGRVLEIASQTVTFQWGPDEVVISPGLGSDGTGVPQSEFTIGQASDLASAYDETPEETVELEAGVFLIGLKDLEELRDDPQKVLREDLSLRSLPPDSEDGGRSRIELTNVEPGSLPARYGFATGDQIISINGFPVNSEAGAINWYKDHDSEPYYTIVYDRRGALKSVTIHNK